MRIVFLIALLSFTGLEAGHAQPSLGVIEGSVWNLSGKPISGATVYAYNTDRMTGNFRRFTTVTNSHGAFALGDLPPGNYRVHAYKEADGYGDTFFYFFTTNNKSAWKNVQVTSGPAQNVKLELGPKCARLEISIKNGSEQPIKGGLSFWRAGQTGSPSYSTSVEPETSMLVPPVPFRFDVEAKGYETWHSRTFSPRSGEILKLAIQLKAVR
jgi:carboxypeptidase family protein